VIFPRLNSGASARLRCAVLICIISVARAASPDPSAPRVHANGEDLIGGWSDLAPGVAVFRGIPFAAPPVGELRWRKPRPHTPRAGEQPATEYAAACMQTGYIIDWYADVAEVFGGGREDVGKPNGFSEDCLFLNVWTPNVNSGVDDEAKLPVMVWFHGGSNKSGWSYEPNYHGDRLAARGVVVVTVAYRLGALGFFSHPAMQATPDEPIANFGWIDAGLALAWVQANIAAFGGDRNNVTAFGESSGAGDLTEFLARDIGTGLMHRAIAQSPASDFTTVNTLADEQRNGLKIAAMLGIDNAPDTMSRLRAVPAEQLLEAASRALPGHYYDVAVDSQTVYSPTLARLERATKSTIDLLIGTNADEWYMYLDEELDAAAVDQWLMDTAPEAADVLRAQVADESDPRRALDRLRTAKDYLCSARSAAARITATGGRAWVYQFTRQRPGPGGEKLGAYHGTEIPYVFDMHDAWLPTEDIDRALTDAVMDYWVQFARTGDPNLPGRPTWPLYRAEQPAVMELGEEIRVIPPFDAALCLWLGPQ